MAGDQYRKLATVCGRHNLRLLLCGDRDHHNHHGASTKLTMIDVKRGDELVARVSLREHTLDTAADVCLSALEKAGIT